MHSFYKVPGQFCALLRFFAQAYTRSSYSIALFLNILHSFTMFLDSLHSFLALLHSVAHFSTSHFTHQKVQAPQRSHCMWLPPLGHSPGPSCGHGQVHAAAAHAFARFRNIPAHLWNPCTLFCTVLRILHTIVHIGATPSYAFCTLFCTLVPRQRPLRRAKCAGRALQHAQRASERAKRAERAEHARAEARRRSTSRAAAASAWGRGPLRWAITKPPSLLGSAS